MAISPEHENTQTGKKSYERFSALKISPFGLYLTFFSFYFCVVLYFYQNIFSYCQLEMINRWKKTSLG